MEVVIIIIIKRNKQIRFFIMIDNDRGTDWSDLWRVWPICKKQFSMTIRNLHDWDKFLTFNKNNEHQKGWSSRSTLNNWETNWMSTVKMWRWYIFSQRRHEKHFFRLVLFHCFQDVSWVEFLKSSILACQKLHLLCHMTCLKIFLASCMSSELKLRSQVILWSILTVWARFWFHHLCLLGQRSACLMEVFNAVKIAWMMQAASLFSWDKKENERVEFH